MFAFDIVLKRQSRNVNMLKPLQPVILLIKTDNRFCRLNKVCWKAGTRAKEEQQKEQ